MDRDILLEEIRTRLREAQEDCDLDPWIYQDEDLIMGIRSAIRHLRALKVTLALDLSLTGAFDTDPTETQGMLIALRVCSDLLRGDLSKKLSSGELGVSARSVVDSWSTIEASKGLKKASDSYKEDFDTLLTIVLSDGIDTASGVFGQQETSFGDA